MRTRVKICGITRPEDGIAAARLGADAIGLVFYAPSPRAVTVAQAQAVCAALPPFVSVVGLFVDAPAAEVLEVLQAVPLDVLQFHGDEAPAYCGAFGRPYLKALRMRDGLDVAAEARRYADAQGLLLDTYVPGAAGGTGRSFDWARVPQKLDKPVILAGGLTPDNVAEAIATARPYAVDVSGGVEQARGIKSAEKMAAFMRGVESAQDR
ncbi:phosphoribosylanthranilate isomerase [Sulfurivermis fontis]|uniref:phosphoribosylanthranilate isomerase n=1 Tax=Sulfurivermis fontis TaxID=1972068 RepID=UPI000FDAB8D5|nr:phosphoribosylanthranilate isomerase [Sulfurivermis fontis]